MAMKTSVVAVALLMVIAMQAQLPPVASTGSDGALELTTPGVVVFDPRSFNPPHNPSHDNVFQFTTIQASKNAIFELRRETCGSSYPGAEAQ